MKNFLLIMILFLIATTCFGNAVNVLPKGIWSNTVSSINAAATYNSDVYVLRSPNYAVMAQWQSTGASSASGALKLQGSTDGKIWVDIASSEVTISGSGSTLWNKDDAGYLYGRVNVGISVGSANFYIKVNRK